MNNESHTYTVRQFARLLGISSGTAYAAARTGRLAGVPVIFVGARMVIPRAAADRVLRGEVSAMPTESVPNA